MPHELRLGTRGSRLARAQSTMVAQAITAKTGVPVRLVIISTKGDRIVDRPLAAIGGKGLFTAELEAALHSHDIDLAVHSLKDLPTEDPDGLVIAATPTRADPRDVLVGSPLLDLPDGARVGTGSLRRACQLKALHPGVEVVGIRGNVDTRLRKKDDGEVDAVVLAAAGLARLGLVRPDAHPFSAAAFIPAVGQGVLGVQAAADRPDVLQRLRTIHDPQTWRCVLVERTFLAAFGGGCNVAAGCYADVLPDGRLRGMAMAQHQEGAALQRVQLDGTDPKALGQALAEALLTS